MKSRRWRIILIGALLATVGALVPIIMMAWMSWHIAVEKELSLLDLFAQRVLTRADNTFSDAMTVLEAMEKSGLTPCTPTHIARMRDQTINSPVVDEIGYFDGGLMQCNSWGLVVRRRMI